MFIIIIIKSVTEIVEDNYVLYFYSDLQGFTTYAHCIVDFHFSFNLQDFHTYKLG